MCRTHKELLLLFLFAVWTSSNAQVLINTSTVAAGGITPGDAPGYPATISTSGSYELTSNLSPGTLEAITVTGSNVTIDLNGFVIDGGGTCAVATQGNSCMLVTLNALIHVTGSNVVIKNGIVRGNKKGYGIGFYGASSAPINSTLKDLTVIENVGDGIYVQAASGLSLIDVISSQNGGWGINLANVSQLHDVQASYNNSGGVQGTTMLSNEIVTTANAGNGIMGSVNVDHGLTVANTGYGVSIGTSGVVTHVMATSNVQPGIQVSSAAIAALVADDTSNSNAGYGFDLGSQGCYHRIVAAGVSQVPVNGGTLITSTFDPCP